MSWRDKWWTKEEAIDRFGISESTFYRWRTRHSIAASRLTRRHPLVYNVDDLLEADAAEHAKNPINRHADRNEQCYAGASARNDTGVVHP